MQRNIRSKKDLEIYLQKLKRSNTYRNDLEQYPTDASLASEILFLAYLDGNVEGMVVGDFGSGNGILGIGASLLGASGVHCVEVDPEQCAVIRSNSDDLNIEVHEMDMRMFSTPVETVVMNPPFGSVTEKADRAFLDKAVELSDHIYSIHNFKSADFVRNFYSRNARITRENFVNIRVPRIYAHHTRDNEFIKGVFFSCEVDH